MSTAEITALREAFTITKEAIIKIASCESHHPDDVVALAKKTLATLGIRVTMRKDNKGEE